MHMLRDTAALLFIPALAAAHAHLLTARPAAGSIVATAPKTLDLAYSEAIEPALTNVIVTDKTGAHFETGVLRPDPADARNVSVGLKPLPRGTYTVTWRAVSTDTHKTQGNFHFTVGQ